MATLGLGTSIEATKELLNQQLADQVDFLSKPIIDNYKKQIMEDNNIKEVAKGSYVQIDPKDIEKFSVSNTTSSDGLNKKEQEIINKKADWNNVLTRIKNIVPGDIDNFAYGDKKVSYDGKKFRIEVAGSNQGRAFETKEQVIDYLRKVNKQ